MGHAGGAGQEGVFVLGAVVRGCEGSRQRRMKGRVQEHFESAHMRQCMSCDGVSAAHVLMPAWRNSARSVMLRKAHPSGRCFRGGGGIP